MTALSVRIPGVSNRLEMPDSAANSTTADIEIIARMKLDDWDAGPVTFFEKDNFPAAGRSFQMSTNSFGVLLFYVWNAVGAETLLFHGSTLSALTDGTYYWIRVTFDADNGAGSCVWTVQYAADQITIPASWTTIGSPITSTATNVGDSTAPLTIGSNGGDGMIANVKYFSFSSTIGGAPTAVFDASLVPATSPTNPPSSAQTGGTWSLVGSAVWEVAPGGWSVGSVRIA